MIDRAVCARLGLALIVFFWAGLPAMAYKWPGYDASLGGVIAAKVIGQRCPGVLSASEIGELDAYLAKDASETAKLEEAKKKAGGYTIPYEEFRKGLTEDYERKYSDPRNCDSDAVEEAKDMLQRVRKVMASGLPLHPVDGRPSAGEVITARVTGEKCEGSLTALELAELELYLAKYWISLARSATDEDARLTMQTYKTAENDVARGWRSKDCTAEAIGKAKDVVARVHKSDNERDR